MAENSKEFFAWFQCAEGCSGKYNLNEVIYRCPACGGLLEVKQDLEKVKNKFSPAELKTLFDDRYKRTDWPYGSGVWGKKEIVCPVIENENIVSTYEGASNLFWAERLGHEIGVPDLWIKQCGNSHTGSFKDLGMTVLVSMVKQMRSEGKNIPAVACASTGDTSASLASYCAMGSIQSIVFLPRRKVSNAQLIQPLANGALTLSLDTDFDGCMKIVQEVCTKNNIYLANSMNSLRIEGQKTVSYEIVQQFDWAVPDTIIIPGGNLGNVAALGKGFLEMEELGLINKRPRIICAQAQNANPLYLSYLTDFTDFNPVQAKTTQANAIQIGNPVSYKKAVRVLKQFNGIVEDASEDELCNAAAKADKTGLYNCPHTGVALAALFKLVDKGVISSRERVVVISTAHGLKFTEFKLQYHESRLEGVDSKYANLPVELPAEYNAVINAIEKHLQKTGA